MEYQQEIEVEGVDILGRKVTKEYKGIKIKISHNNVAIVNTSKTDTLIKE